MNEIRMPTQPVILGHRGGAAGGRPANTLQAIADGLAQGADGVEIDVCVTADNEIVLHHDQYLRGRPICELNYAELGKLPTPPPRLHAVVKFMNQAAYRNCILNVELKNNARDANQRREYVMAVTAALRRRNNFRETVVVQSFNRSLRRLIKAALPAVRVGVTCQPRNLSALKLAEIIARANRDRADILSIEHTALNRARLRQIRNSHAHLEVHAWTVNARAHIARLAELGVDAIITDYPARCGEVLRREVLPGDK